ncbi:MAG: hypothetical protein JXA25_12845, partial [Anaerolineales bacterium]|nr:hypothetical protein [Anaerolineales bacterium]
MSENMESSENGEVRESRESQDSEGQRLQEATTSPEAHVEQTQVYQQAEAVEEELKTVIDSTLAAAPESAASSAVAEQGAEEISATPITLPDAERQGGDEVSAIPITVPDEAPDSGNDQHMAGSEGIRVGSEEVEAIPITVSDSGMQGPESPVEKPDAGKGVVETAPDTILEESSSPGLAMPGGMDGVPGGGSGDVEGSGDEPDWNGDMSGAGPMPDDSMEGPDSPTAVDGVRAPEGADAIPITVPDSGMQGPEQVSATP